MSFRPEQKREKRQKVSCQRIVQFCLRLNKKARIKSEKTEKIEKIKQIEKNSLQDHETFLFFPNNKNHFGERASSSTFRKGSLTLETAFVLPLFFLCICTILCFMDIYRLQMVKLDRLCAQTREMAMYAYVTDVESDVEHSSVYRFVLPVSVVPLPPIVMRNTVRVHPWTGYRKQAGERESEEMVYMAETGNVYHKDAQCSYLNLSVTGVPGRTIESRRNRSGAKYYGCEKCVGNHSPAATVYITDYGTRFHNSSSCSKLKRRIRLVKKSDCKNIRCCSRCGGG